MELKAVPFVAIWMVTYNHESFIEQAVESVMMQKTNFEYKLFIGEDCSTDNASQICEKLKENYPDKIELFLNDKNLGGNLNALQIYYECFKSGAKYVALLEGDDYWTDPLKLQKQVDFLEANLDYNICFHEVKVFNQDKNCLEEDTITRNVLETTTVEDLAKGNYIHTPSVMFRNNFTIPSWFTKSPIGDWTLYMIAIKDKKIKKLNDKMSIYRVHNSGIWSKKEDYYRINQTIKSYKLVYSYAINDVEIKELLKKKIEHLKAIQKQKDSFLNKIKRLLNG